MKSGVKYTALELRDAAGSCSELSQDEGEVDTGSGGGTSSNSCTQPGRPNTQFVMIVTAKC